MMANEPDTPKRGRPKVEEPRSSVSTWMPATYHDRLIRLANQNEVSVSSMVRRILVLQLQTSAK
jgi:hypothetical protein